ncbi:MAG: ABC transporter substrate-binding protein [Clostridiaceae bacterium]|nr:ABC transporter substrate-binding protein [Clostridiaceae bacterium]
MVGMKRTLSVIVSLLLIGVLLVGCTDTSTSPAEDVQEATETTVIQVGITQIIEHPALDAAREGFIDGLAAEGFIEGENIAFELQNAQGEIATAQTIGESFSAQKKDLILAIATPTAQTAFQATKDIPILITAVTDPVAAGLVDSWERSGTNVTGTSDATPPEKHFQLMKTFVPNAKRVGILYNTSETNSEVQVNTAKEVASNFGMEIVTASVNSINDVNQSLDYLLSRVDVLYTIKDNVVASSMPLITTKAIENNIPVIGAEPAHVKGGALATEGVDYYRLGLQTASMAVEVLNGKNPADMSIGTLEDLELSINLDTAEKLNLTIPEDLKKNATLIKDGVVQND